VHLGHLDHWVSLEEYKKLPRVSAISSPVSNAHHYRCLHIARFETRHCRTIAQAYARNTEWPGRACCFFSGKPLRASEGIGYDAGLFGRDDKRLETASMQDAGA
jgi:hypothetical protein